MRSLCFLFVLITLLFCSGTRQSNAFEGFNEDFNGADSLNWNYTENGGSFIFNNGYLSMGSTAYYFPVANLKDRWELFSTDSDSVLEIRFRFDQITNAGNGIGVGFTGNNGRPYYEFGIWADDYYKMYFLYNDYFNPTYVNCTSFTNQDYYSGLHIIPFGNDKNWHILRIEKKGKKWADEKYYVYLDKKTNPVPIFTTSLYPCNPKNLWLGNPLTGGPNWTQFSIDYLKAYDDIDPQIEKRKIILIPGLGASWNTRAMVYNDTVPDNKWAMTPFVNNYNGIIKAFEDNGLVKDSDYFVWNYDWRRPIGETVKALDLFINSKVGDSEKVDLVGHSLGGVVARIWGQDHLGDVRLDRVISVGSPQKGSVEAYEAWNGAKVGDNASLSGVALNLMLQLQKKNKQGKVETVRKYAPVVSDLIPIYDFIKRKGVVIKSSDLVNKNSYLMTRNVGVEGIYNKYLAVIGTGEKTREWINVGEASGINKLIGEWPDGKPLSYVYTNDGDGTVLKKSALLDDSIVEVASTHGDVVNKGLTNILAELGLEGTGPVIDDTKLMGRLLFFIGSPAGIGVSCDGGSLIEDNGQGFVVIDSTNKKACSLIIKGTENGTYHLVTAKIGEEDSWRYWENEIVKDGIDVIMIDGRSGTSQEVANDSYWYKLLEREIKSLLVMYPGNNHLKKALAAVNRKEIDLVVEYMMNFRKMTKEVLATNRIVDISREILVGRYRKSGSVLLKMAWEGLLKEIELISRTAGVVGQRSKAQTQYLSANYEKIEELVSDGTNNLERKSYPAVWADMTLVSKMLTNTW